MEIQEEKKKGTERMFKEIMGEDFSNLEREIDIQIYESQGTPNKWNLNRTILRHITIKLSKVKDKEIILTATREKREVTYTGTTTRL